MSFPTSLLRAMIHLAMRAMVMERPREPLVLEDVHQPEPGLGQVLVRVAACAVCRTDLHGLDGDLPEPKLPLIPAFPYRGLWHERTLCLVANLTREDGEEFLQLAPTIPVRTETQAFRLEKANEVRTLLREGRVRGAAALLP